MQLPPLRPSAMSSSVRDWRAGILLAVVALLLMTPGRAAADVIFFDDFSANAGWTLGPNWEIGATSVSPYASSHPDPASDHSSTDDNGVLGAKLGGNVGATEGVHDFYYATSPIFNLAGYTNVELSYFRWLNSDSDPYMTSTLEAYDGASWQVLFTNGAQAIMDSAWTQFVHNVSAIADGNSQFQLRFGYKVGSADVYSISGWNVDDVRLTGDAAVSGLSSVPEPASLLLFGGSAAAALAGARRRKKTHSC